MPPDTNQHGGSPTDDAGVARKRAEDARRRALAAHHAAEQATTEYARRSNHRVADLHDKLAVSHEDFARRIRFGGRRGSPDGTHSRLNRSARASM